MDVRIEIRDNEDEFVHRLVRGRKRGKWVGYTCIATLGDPKKDGVIYASCTGYFEGVLPIECVLKVEKVRE